MLCACLLYDIYQATDCKWDFDRQAGLWGIDETLSGFHVLVQRMLVYQATDCNWDLAGRWDLKKMIFEMLKEGYKYCSLQ